MKMYVIAPLNNAWKVSYLTNAIGNNDRLFINEVKSEKAGVVTPGLLPEAQALGYPNGYVETTHTVLMAFVDGKNSAGVATTLSIFEDGEAAVTVGFAASSSNSPSASPSHSASSSPSASPSSSNSPSASPSA